MEELALILKKKRLKIQCIYYDLDGNKIEEDEE